LELFILVLVNNKKF